MADESTIRMQQMTVNVSLAPWFSTALTALLDLERIGFSVDVDDIDRLVQSAVVVEDVK